MIRPTLAIPPTPVILKKQLGRASSRGLFI
jgi:hypothetical protein